MRISLLLKREPFPEIFERTLKDFMQSRFNTTCKVTWHASGTKLSLNSNSQTWLCNPYLNAIFVRGASRQVLLPVIQEFSRSTKPWRTPLQRLYVWLATAQFAARLFSTARVEIFPPLKNAENKLIIGGNHHIRVLDYDENCCYVINKSGFNKELISNETKVRKAHPFLPAPAIKKIEDDVTWYSEELIVGTPINRLKNVQQAGQAVRKVSLTLFQLYEKTKEIKMTQNYATGLVQKISGQIDDSLLLGMSEKEDIRKDVRELERRIRSFVADNVFITIVQSHGDFQPANILADGERIWLIDWEYTGRRQISYDGLVYSLDSRFPEGLGQRIKKMMDSDLAADREIIALGTETQWNRKTTRRCFLLIFLLEELELRLKEINNRTYKTIGDGFLCLLKEIRELLGCL